MKTSEFLFPSDLEITPINYKKVIFIGSCLSEVYVNKLRIINPNICYDFILFNNASELPNLNDKQVTSSDFQYIQIPLRSVLTDTVIRVVESAPLDLVSIGKRNIDIMLSSAMQYNIRYGILSFISNFIVPQGRLAPSLHEQDTDYDLTYVVRQLNVYLAHEVSKYQHAFIADIDMIANTLGKKFFLDDIITFSTHGSVIYPNWTLLEQFPEWTKPEQGRLEAIPDISLTYEIRDEEFFDAVFRQIDSLFRIVKQIDKVKVVIFDLDNTLWRGQLVEHYQPGLKWPYSDGWPLGMWEVISHLRRRGIIVTLVSKNDENLVISKWFDAVQPPFVKFEDFLLPQINWNPKGENIRLILEKLSLTSKSALFIDDNPVERESVKTSLPGIRVLGTDPFILKRILMYAPETQIASRTKETISREEMLKMQIERDNEKVKMSRNDFLSSLMSKVNIYQIFDVNHPAFNRVFELVNKTNQFNTTGNRWSMEDYYLHFKNGGKVFVFSVKDRFVEYGTVGVVFTMHNRIVQFVMSCRVLGTDIEKAVIIFIIKKTRLYNNSNLIVASLVETEANMPCRTLFLDCGFNQIEKNEFQLFDDSDLSMPNHVEITYTD